MTALVSVMIPFYNSTATLPWALASLLAQTFEDWECILVDDGSTDHPENIMRFINDSRFIYHRHERNLGRGRARQTALDIASAELLAFLDADDWLYPEKLATQVKIMDEYPKLGFVTCGMTVVDNENSIIGCRGIRNKSCELVLYEKVKCLSPPKIAFPPSIVRMCLAKEAGFDSNLLRAQDTDFLFRISRNTAFGVIPRLLYSYRWTPETLDKTLLITLHNRKLYLKYTEIYPISSRIKVFEFYIKELLFRTLYPCNLEGLILRRRNKRQHSAATQDFVAARNSVAKRVAEIFDQM